MGPVPLVDLDMGMLDPIMTFLDCWQLKDGRGCVDQFSNLTCNLLDEWFHIKFQPTKQIILDNFAFIAR